jgi:TIR domain
VWRDTASLWPGEDWAAKIRQAITQDALVFIACFSRESIAREKTYQREELLLAIEQLRLRRPGEPWLIPVRFDDCVIPNLDIGGGRMLASIQRIDLFGESTDENTERLVATVQRLLKRHSISANSTATQSQPTSNESATVPGRAPSTPRRSPFALRSVHRLTSIAIGGAIAVVVAAVTVSIYADNSGAPGRSQTNSSRTTPAASVGPQQLSSLYSFMVNVPPAAFQESATRPQAITEVIGELNQQLAAKHLQHRKAADVTVFASGPISGIGLAMSTANYVLHILYERDPIFAKATGQGYWSGQGDGFEFQIRFFS